MTEQPTNATERNIPQPGQVLAGKFRVERVLGAGGMGVVVAAHHLLLDRRVALKFLLPEMNPTPTIVARFAREAKAAARIQSEHVARVIDVGTLETGAPYMVMEYLEGRDLGAELDAHKTLPTATAVDWLLQACEALAEAHAAGIVHRDLKPGNLFLTKRADGSPLVKVLDFGISKHLLIDSKDPAAGPALTQTMAQLGSPAYMSPEQLKSSKDVDARTDLWALGLILQEMLTGKSAFSATSIVELNVAILTHPPRPLRSLRPELPETLELVVARCLEKDVARRYQNVAEFSAALAPFGSAAARHSAETIARVLGMAASAAGPAPSPVGPTVAQSPAHAAGQPGYGGYPPMAPGSGPGMHAQAQLGVGPYAAHGGQAGPPPASPFGPGPGPMPPAGYGGFPPGYQPGPPPGPPMGMTYVRPPPEQGTSTTVIVLVVILATIVFVMGGCVLCVCVSAAGQSNRVPDELREHWARLPGGAGASAAAVASSPAVRARAAAVFADAPPGPSRLATLGAEPAAVGQADRRRTTRVRRRRSRAGATPR